MNNNILIYVSITFLSSFNESLKFLVNNLSKYKVTIRNIWNDTIHTPQAELEGEEVELRKFYNFLMNDTISDDDWRKMVESGPNYEEEK